MSKRNLLYAVLLLLFPVLTKAQSGEITQPKTEKSIERKDQEWVHYYNRLLISPKSFLTIDGGIRRNSSMKVWEEYIVRAGLNYRLHYKVNVGAGAAFDYLFETAKPEMRFHEEINTSNKEISKFIITNRIRLEERFISITRADSNGFEGFDFSFRVRYKLNVIYPLYKERLIDDTFFLVAEDELFFNLGQDIVNNVFDRNRLGGGFGYRYTKNLMGTLQYSYQFTQNNMGKFTHSDIVWLSLFHTFDFTGRKKQIPTGPDENTQ